MIDKFVFFRYNNIVPSFRLSIFSYLEIFIMNRLHNSKLLCVFTALLLSLVLFMSCGEEEASSENFGTEDAPVSDSEITVEVTETEAEPLDTADTSAPEETTGEEVTSEDTSSEDTVTEEASDTDTAESETEPEPETEPADTTVINPLTGIPSEVDYMQRRPVAIMINNVRTTVGGENVITAQHGISKADIMYEAVVEGGLTRLMMVVSDYETLPEIGSVRSSREYFLDFASNHDAIYVHAGGSDEAYNQINNVRNTDNIDFVNPVNGVSMYAYNYRNTELMNKGYLLEHTLMTDGSKIASAIQRMRYRTDLRNSFDSPLDFVKLGEVRVPEGGNATYISVRYTSWHMPYYRYDASRGVYLRYQYGDAHIDQVTGEQLAFDNIILLYCPSYNTQDAKQHQSVNTTGTGNGYYFTNGKYEEITWRKDSVSSPVKLYNAAGEHLLVNRGKTFFQIAEKSMESYTVIQ